jgi:hypothetical protein
MLKHSYCLYLQRDVKLGDNKGDHKHSEESEQSQSDTITYDDPAGRLEREKIMARLKRGCSPSPDEFIDNNDDDDDDDKDGNDKNVDEYKHQDDDKNVCICRN